MRYIKRWNKFRSWFLWDK